MHMDMDMDMYMSIPNTIPETETYDRLFCLHVRVGSPT